MVRPQRILHASMSVVGIVHSHVAVTVAHVRTRHWRRHGTDAGSWRSSRASVLVVLVTSRRDGRRRGLLWMRLGLGRKVARGHGLLVGDSTVVSTRSAGRVGVVLPLGIHGEGAVAVTRYEVMDRTAVRW